MMELETGIPSTKMIQSYVKDKRSVEIKLLTNDVLTGQVFWQDPQCICISDGTIIYRQAIAYIKAR
jgi:host factor-I protein